MTPFWTDDHLTLYGGDCRAVLAELPAESVHTVVTSPPYWGLRDYGTASWDGGDEACDHVARKKPPTVGSSSTLGYPSDGGRRRIAEGNQYHNAYTEQYADACGKCGARRIDSQLGLEATPEEYVANMVAVFREVRRVLRADGTLWLNLGDSYNGVGRGEKANGLQVAARATTQRTVHGLKPKDLVGIPWRVAFALQADGWYLRSDIIWSKPNPMPESVTDRPTKAHEYLFLLTKSPRYYFDADAVREPAIRVGEVVKASDPATAKNGQKGQYGATALGFTQHDTTVGSGRNLRSVWTIATEPYPGAHFATFPRKLVEPCIKAGTSERGVCPECGAPWVRVVEVESRPNAPSLTGKYDGNGKHRTISGGVSNDGRRRTASGWRPSCDYDGDPVPATVLDPFAGSGTTLLVAQALGRRGVGIDLNPAYLQQAIVRASREFGKAARTEDTSLPTDGLWELAG